MQIFVKGVNSESLVFSLNSTTSVAELKSAIELQSGIPAVFQSLLLEGELMSDSTNLSSSVQPNSTIFMNLGLLGGKKGKKKQYKTKKKNKHRHHKEKLTSLRYYNIDSANKIVRTHLPCPECAKGIYMAKHWDRYYCGTCHLTLKLDPATIKANAEALAKKKANKTVEVEVVEEKKGGKKGGKKK